MTIEKQLPCVNDISLEIEEVQALLTQTNLLEVRPLLTNDTNVVN